MKNLIVIPSLFLAVVASAQTLTLAAGSCSGAALSGKQLTAYEGCTLAATGGIPPYMYSVASGLIYAPLPEGMILNAATGAISGTIHGQGDYTTQLVVTDSKGETANLVLTFPIAGDNTFGGTQLFPMDAIFHTRIDALPVDTSPAAAIPAGSLTAVIHPIFGTGWNNFPNGIPILTVPCSQPMTPVNGSGYQYFSKAPIPGDAPIEGTPTGLQKGSDSHVLVVQTAGCGNPAELWEMYSASYNAATGWTTAGTAYYPNLGAYNMLAQDAGGADAAGLPIAPLLINYDEVAGGTVQHPVRFTIGSSAHAHVWPASDQAGTGTCSGGGGENSNGMIDQANPPASCANTPAQGEIYRIKASVCAHPPDACLLDKVNCPQSSVIFTGLCHYGLELADNGGAGFIVGTPDSRWNDLDLAHLKSIPLSDIEPVNVSSIEAVPDNVSSYKAIQPEATQMKALALALALFLPTNPSVAQTLEAALSQQGMGPGPGTPASSGGGSHSFSVVQYGTCVNLSTGYPTTLTCTLGSGLNAGDSVLIFSSNAVYVTSTVNSLGTLAWFPATFNTVGEMGFITGGSTGATSFTVPSMGSYESTTNNVIYGIAEVAGVNSSAPIETSTGITNNYSAVSPTVTTTGANDEVCAFVFSSTTTSTFTAGAGYSLLPFTGYSHYYPALVECGTSVVGPGTYTPPITATGNSFYFGAVAFTLK